MFTIKIIENRKVKKIVKDTWGVIGTKEVDREERYYRDDSAEPKTRIEEVRGYLPPVETESTEEREVFSQKVEELNVAAVIKAINGL